VCRLYYINRIRLLSWHGTFVLVFALVVATG
jgi:hypothetical protein